MKEIQMPNTTMPFLRFQVGESESRLEQVPIYEGKRVAYHRTGPGSVGVFRLLGFGETQEKAYKMAGVVPPNEKGQR